MFPHSYESLRPFIQVYWVFILGSSVQPFLFHILVLRKIVSGLPTVTFPTTVIFKIMLHLLPCLCKVREDGYCASLGYCAIAANRKSGDQKSNLKICNFYIENSYKVVANLKLLLASSDSYSWIDWFTEWDW